MESIFDGKKLGRYLGITWIDPDTMKQLIEEEMDNFYSDNGVL